MVAVKREPEMRGANVWFRGPKEGDSEERKSEVGWLSLSGVVFILLNDEIVVSGSEGSLQGSHIHGCLVNCSGKVVVQLVGGMVKEREGQIRQLKR